MVTEHGVTQRHVHIVDVVNVKITQNLEVALHEVDGHVEADVVTSRRVQFLYRSQKKDVLCIQISF